MCFLEDKVNLNIFICLYKLWPPHQTQTTTLTLQTRKSNRLEHGHEELQAISHEYGWTFCQKFPFLKRRGPLVDNCLCTARKTFWRWQHNNEIDGFHYFKSGSHKSSNKKVVALLFPPTPKCSKCTCIEVSGHGTRGNVSTLVVSQGARLATRRGGQLGHDTGQRAIFRFQFFVLGFQLLQLLKLAVRQFCLCLQSCTDKVRGQF